MAEVMALLQWSKNDTYCLTIENQCVLSEEYLRKPIRYDGDTVNGYDTDKTQINHG